jgi:pantetheine-phosphate adenylyltransferase
VRPTLEQKLAAVAAAHSWAFEVRPLDEPTGIATEPAFDALVVSPETIDGAARVNEARRVRGLNPLRVEVVDHVLAADGEPISSTRIVRGEIDEYGAPTATADGRGVDPPD